MTNLKSGAMLIHPLLHFSLVLVPALGLTDAVLPSPVQDLLELLLLSAEQKQDTRVALKQKAAIKRNKLLLSSKALEACIQSDQRLLQRGLLTATPLQSDFHLSVSWKSCCLETNKTHFSHVSLSFFS